MPKLNLITLGGVTKSLTQWCEAFHIDRKVVSARIHNYGWPVMQALMTPAHSHDLTPGVTRRGKRFEVTHTIDRKPLYLFSLPDLAEAEKLAAAATRLRERVGAEQFRFMHAHQREILLEWIRNEARAAVIG